MIGAFFLTLRAQESRCAQYAFNKIRGDDVLIAIRKINRIEDDSPVVEYPLLVQLPAGRLRQIQVIHLLKHQKRKSRLAKPQIHTYIQ